MNAQNEPGVFSGVDHLENTFGTVILVKQSLVVVRHNVAFVESVFPFKEKKPIFTHWESLHRLIGRKNAITKFTTLIIFYLIHSLTSSLLMFHNHTKHTLMIHLHVHLSILSTCHPMMTKLKTF
jgi:hypothetical protein